jgi:prophage regulatory protein
MSNHPKQATSRPTSPGREPPTAGLPATGYIRQRQLLKILPVSPATLWRWVGSGDFVQPVRLGRNVTAWRMEDIHSWMSEQNRVPIK